MRMTGRRAAAYFDVDGTLTRGTTMFELLLRDAAARGRLDEGRTFLKGLRDLQTVGGATREIANREYFRWWAGRPVPEVRRLCREWIEELASRPENAGFHTAPLRRVHRHLRRGETVHLVSGSVPVLLEILSEHLGVGEALGTEMEVVRGRFTGEVDEPMIGERKAEALRRHASAAGIGLAISSGYGDHVSDFPFLEVVGSPVVFTEWGTVEHEFARVRSWEVLHPEG